jgi:hypothetical protein
MPQHRPCGGARFVSLRRDFSPFWSSSRLPLIADPTPHPTMFC